jgi:hypothetical protein
VTNRRRAKRGTNVTLEVGVQAERFVPTGRIERDRDEVHSTAVGAYENTFHGAIVLLLDES